jgi:hypothetical protein
MPKKSSRDCFFISKLASLFYLFLFFNLSQSYFFSFIIYLPFLLFLFLFLLLLFSSLLFKFFSLSSPLPHVGDVINEREGGGGGVGDKGQDHGFPIGPNQI